MEGAPWGGSEELWCATASAALKQGLKVQVLVPRWEPVPTKLAALEKAGALVNRRKTSSANTTVWRRALQKASGLTHHVTGKTAFQTLRAFKPDYILVSQGGTYDVTWHRLLARHINDMGAPFGLLCHSLSPQTLPDESTRLSAKAWFQRAAFVGFVSRATHALAEHQLASPIPNAKIIRNPVNLVDVSLVPYPTDIHPLRFACVGSLTATWKGQDLLLRALSSERWNDRAWEAHVYGTGPDDAYLKQLACFYGLSSRLHFHGHVADVRCIWERSHAHVMPSRVESAPLALVEAMLCGRPSIATAVGGIPEWLTDGETGFLATHPSGESISAALDRAWNQRDRWQEIGRKAREHALARTPQDAGLELLNQLI